MPMKTLRVVIFALFMIVLLPLFCLGMFGYTLKLWIKNRGISGTAYEPLFGRLLMHYAGTREDLAAEKLAPHLPALSPAVTWLLIRTLGLASRWSGYRGLFFAYPPRMPSSLLALVNHRTAFFDAALADAIGQLRGQAAQQIVLLGSGWDTRAYGKQLYHDNMRVFEVDTPKTLATKKRALERAGIQTAHVTFVETDFGQTSWLSAILSQGFDPSLPTFILWEGVTMYLDEATVKMTLKQVATLAAGTRIAFDTLSQELVQSESPFMLLGRCVKLGMKFYGEPWIFGVSTRKPARDHLTEFVVSQGLTLEAYEAFGEERGAKTPFGGLGVAVNFS